MHPKNHFGNFKNKEDTIRKIKHLPLSVKTINDRSNKMSANITEQLIEDVKLASVISIAVNEFYDISDISQNTLYIRCISPDGPLEELLGLLQLMSQTCGEDIAVIEGMNKSAR